MTKIPFFQFSRFPVFRISGFSKPWRIIQLAFIQAFEYRTESLLWMILESISFIIFVLILVNIYSDTPEYNSYNLSQVVTYYLIGFFINRSTSGHFEEKRVEKIRNGKIDFSLIKPIGYLKEIFFFEVGGKLFNIIFSFPLTILMIFLISAIFNINFSAIEWQNFDVFLFLIIAAFFIEYLIGQMIVLVGFWLDGAAGLEHFKWIILTLFSGWLVPIEFMSAELAKVINALPLKYMYAYPINILLGKYQMLVFDWLYLWAFIAILFLTNYVINFFAQRAYGSYGG